jgi:two-component system sensor histidine kinase/response regulator
MNVESSGNLPRLLFVDDEPSNLMMFEAAFFEYYDILLAHNAAEAKEILAINDVQVIISDQRMPQMNGAALLAAARTTYPDAVRILVTGFSDIEDAISAINEGKIHRYIKKPWNNTEFKLAIDEALQFYYVHKERDELLVTLEEKVKRRTKELEAANTLLEEQNVQLQDLNQEKTEILSIISHDLRNPLGAISGLTDVLQNESDFAIGSPERKDIFIQISRAIQRMKELINNLLSADMLESGTMPVRLVSVSANGILGLLVEEYQTRAEAKNISIHFSAEQDYLVKADEQLFYQVCENLVSNAVKYSPRNTNVWISMIKSPDNTGSSENIRLSFRDEGPGISTDDQKRLFKRFARLSAQPTGGEHSTGLGLSIVRKMVEAMNGKVWCESVPGKGAEFIVELPMGVVDTQ